MIDDKERRKVAQKLREPKESLLAYQDDELIRLRNETGCPRGQDFYEHLADLIDPTCHLVGTTSEEGLYGPTVFRYELSCGHTCHTDCPEPPAYCCECGCRVIA